MQFRQWKRREVITLLGGAAAWPFAARAQQGGARRIGVLMMYAQTDRQGQSFVAAFQRGLQAHGWLSSRNVEIDYRWTLPDSADRVASEIVALKPEVILSSSTPTTAALLKQTRAIPIVFANIVDPVGSGFVANLARPGGNVTGFLNFHFSMAGKWVELLREIAPNVTTVAAVFNRTAAPYADNYLDHFTTATVTHGMKDISVSVRSLAELEAFMAGLAREANAGIVVIPDAFMVAHQAEIALLAARHRLPVIYFFRGFAEAGGLLSYGNDILDNYRRAAGYVDRVLKGERAMELPVQAPVKFELVVNLKAAKALGLAVPDRILAVADEVIE
jgi:putative tryptophan/tyrosine transport system substrate-binding protein